jgi:hypothetical protein
VELQRGNPARETLSGDTVGYTVSWTYTYDDRNRPLTKVGDLTWTKGPDIDQQDQVQSSFSYY